MNFELLVIAALAGLCVRALIGINPGAAVVAVGFAILVIPGVLKIGMQHDTAVAMSMTAAYTERLTDAFPSMMIGQIAGFFANEIFALFQGIVNEFAS